MSFFFLILYIIATFIRPQEWVPGMLNWKLINILACTTIFFILFERMSSRKLTLIKVPQNFFMALMFFAILMSHVVHTYFAGFIAAFYEFSTTFILFLIMLNGINSETK